jgi:predicted dehydrogenase
MGINIAVAGIGAGAEMHARAIVSIGGAELVAGSCRTESKGTAFADEFDCEWYADTEAMLDAEDIDAVSVCTPSGTHADVVTAVARAGAHVICEKPLDVYADRMDAMIEACDEAGVTLAGVFQKRFDPAARRAKKAIDDGTLGELVLGDTRVKWFRSQPYYDSSEWRGTRDMDGGVLMSQAIHLIDRLLWFAGDVDEVWATVDNVDRALECEDTAALAIRFESGMLGTIEGTTAVKGGRTATEVNGTEGSLTVDGDGLSRFEVGTGEESPYHAETETQNVETDGAEWGDNPEAMMRDFVDAAREICELAVTRREARRAVDLVLAAYAAAERGEPVRPEDVRDGSVGGPQVRAEDRE